MLWAWLHGSMSCTRYPVSATWIRVTEITLILLAALLCATYGDISCKSAKLKSTQRDLIVSAFTCKSANWIVKSEKESKHVCKHTP